MIEDMKIAFDMLFPNAKLIIESKTARSAIYMINNKRVALVVLNRNGPSFRVTNDKGQELGKSQLCEPFVASMGIIKKLIIT